MNLRKMSNIFKQKVLCSKFRVLSVCILKQEYMTSLNHVVQAHAVWIVNAVLLATMKYAHVCQDLSVVHQIVGLSVLSVQNVHKIGHVLIKNALIRASRPVDNMLDVKSLITIQSVHVRLVILVILSFAV